MTLHRPFARFFFATLAALICALASPAWALTDAEVQKALAAIPARQQQVLHTLVARPPAPDTKHTMWDWTNFAMAAYWLQQHQPEADQAMIAACQRDALQLRGNEEAPTSKHTYYRQLYLLERVYFLFNARSEYFPGRMSPAAEKAVTDMLWAWASTACRKDILAPEKDWWIWGTENIGAVTWSSLWGATQILAGHPDYQDKRYADGTSVTGMAQAFDDYYKRFTRDRAGHGLLVECASDYNKWTLNCWYNIADFSRDPVARQRMKMFLDLYWADWASEQIDAVRGGSRHRCYPGPGSTELSDGGDGPSWYFFGLGQPAITNPAVMCAATTFYRPSPVVMDLALDVPGRGTYASASRRPGLGKTMGKATGGIGFVKDEDFLGESGGHILDPDSGKLLRYTWCTPDFVLGTSMVPPLPLDNWTLISSQNRWEGVIFGGHKTARIFVQPIPNKSFYNGNWSVQDQGVMIVQRLKTALNCSGERVWFDASLAPHENGGWIFAEAPRAYAAVRAVEGGADLQAETPPEKKQRFTPGSWLTCREEFTPVILEVARKSDYPDFPTFQKAILANRLAWHDRRLEYRSDFYKTQLTLYADYSKPPEVNGKPIDYNPPRVFDSPFIQSDFASGIVTLSKGDRQQVLDFTR